MSGIEILGATKTAKDLVCGALEATKQLRQAYIDVKLQPEVLQGFYTQLEDIQAKFTPLGQCRLRTDAAATVVQRLLETVASVMQEMKEELKQQQQQHSLPPLELKRLWLALCVCVAGPSERARRLQMWQADVRRVVESVENEKDNLLPQLRLHQLVCLREPCVTNHGALKQLKDAICGLGASSAVQTAAEGPRVVQLLGLAGMGKSTLALQAALDLDKGGAFSGGVYFLKVQSKPAIDGDTQQAVDTATMAVQKALLRKLRFSEFNKDAATVEDLKGDLVGVFAQTVASYLLVLDDVWDERILDGLRCPVMKGAILVTTRSSMCSDAMGSGMQTVRLQPNKGSRQAAAELMRELLATAVHPKKEIVDSILDRCDGHLLAVDVMGRALRQYSTEEGWQDVAKGFISRLEEDVRDSRQITFSALKAALDSLSAAGDRERRTAVRAFAMLQHLRSRHILPLPMLQLLWSSMYPNEPVGGVREVKPLLDRLVNSSLLYADRQGKGFYTHSLVAEFLAGRQEADGDLPSGYRLPRNLTEVSSSMAGVAALPRSAQLEASSPSSTKVATPSLKKFAVLLRSPVLGHKLACSLRLASSSMAGVAALPQPSQLEPAAPSDTKLASPALMKLAVLLLGYGRSHAVKWAQQLLGVEPVDAVAVTYLEELPKWAGQKSEAAFAMEPEGQLCSRLGRLLMDSGRYMQAEPWLREALTAHRTAHGLEHHCTAASLNGLARLLQLQGKLADAEAMFREALVIRQKVLGREHADTAVSLNNLALLLQDQGKLAEAEAMYREALAIRQKVQGLEHPGTAGSLHNLGWLLQAQGKLGEAESMYKKALAIRQKVLGPKHPSTARSLGNLAWVVRARGKLIEAEPMQRKALAVCQQVLGLEHPDTATHLNRLAVLLQDQGKLPEAEAMCKQALAIRQKVFGPEHSITAASLNNFACLLRAQGKLAEAEPMCREALTIRQKVLEPEHLDIASSLNELALLLQAQGKLTEAEPMYREALTIRQKVQGLEHPGTAGSLHNLGWLLQAQGKLGEAEPMCRKALAIRQKVLGLEHPDTAVSLNDMGLLLQAQGKLTEAEPMYREALAIRQTVLGPEHTDTATCRNNLAALLRALGRLAGRDLVQEGIADLSAKG